MTAPSTAPAPPSRGGRWIQQWDPEDETFWKETGEKVARRNLIFSVLSEHIGFSIWTMWSVLVLFMGPEYGLTPADKFLLTSMVTLVGAVVRVPYTFAVAIFGGRNWTIVSAALLLVPTVAAFTVMEPGTSFNTFLLVGLLAGIGGGNFASSMTNINAFFPLRKKGWALGLNAAWAATSACRCSSWPDSPSSVPAAVRVCCSGSTSPSSSSPPSSPRSSWTTSRT